MVGRGAPPGLGVNGLAVVAVDAGMGRIRREDTVIEASARLLVSLVFGRNLHIADC